jgi:hypothetical protein
MTRYAPLTAALDPDGHVVRWARFDGEGLETTTIRWENEGFTVSGIVTKERVEYVLRLSASWQLRQFMLFRDLEDPDLWLATDGHGRWGEVNGAHRVELDGCVDVLLECTPFTHTPLIRRLPLLDGDTATLPVAVVDVDTLGVRAEQRVYTRLSADEWEVDGREIAVDGYGLVTDEPGRFLRVS